MQDTKVLLRRQNVLGVGVGAVNTDSTIRIIQGRIQSGTREYVCVARVHGVMECQRSAELRRTHNNAGIATPDGMPLAWLLRATGQTESDRVCGPDLMPRLMIEGQARGDAQFVYGATEETLQRLRHRLSELAPQTVAPAPSKCTQQGDLRV
jgi:N-acetylglucosaminyldiphosphoundecaprenol N-acetyl-beta-D-mannosaminyltransferase